VKWGGDVAIGTVLKRGGCHQGDCSVVGGDVAFGTVVKREVMLPIPYIYILLWQNQHKFLC
jgi:hypothetical protein